MKDNPRPALEALLRDYSDLGARSRLGLLVSPRDGKASYKVDVVGVMRSKRLLVLTAPVRPDGSLIAVSKGQLLTCRWFSATTAFHFEVTIARMLFEPIPLLHVELPELVEHRTVRGEPRALATLRAILKTPEPIDAVIVDISIGGARVAIADDTALEKGAPIELSARPHLLHRDYEIELRCHVTGENGTGDLKHPNVRFYGLIFEGVNDVERLILHSYVQQCLAVELDELSQVLLPASKVVMTAA